MGGLTTDCGSFKNMRQVLTNWLKLSDGCITATRLAKIGGMLEAKKNYWDHNVALVWLLEKLKAESYLEVGVLTCGSMVHALCSPHIKRIVGVDVFRSTYADGQYIKNKNVLEDIVKPEAAKFPSKDVQFYKGMSQEILPTINESFDIATVDGDHTEHGAATDLELVLPKVRRAIVMDDIRHQSHMYLKDVAHRFAEKHSLDFTMNEQHPGTVIFWIK
jgi:hypothetical protein